MCSGWRAAGAESRSLFRGVDRAPGSSTVQDLRSTWRRMLPFILVAAGSACETSNPVSAPALATVHLSFAQSTIEVGGATVAIASARDRDGDPIESVAPTFSSALREVATVDSTSGVIVGIAEGAALITAVIEGVSDRKSLTVLASSIRINEIAPNGDRPGGWIELYNASQDTLDMSGWVVSTGDRAHGFPIPETAKIPGLGYLAVNEGNIPLGLGSVGALRLFSALGVEVEIEPWSLSSGAAVSFGRCPNGRGALVELTVATRKAVNACPPDGV
jgi:hypothetical protein